MSNLFDLGGKTAIITGSSRGIGKAIAEQMAAHGARVVISSRKETACQDVAEAINQKYGSGTAIAVSANISSKQELQNLVNQTTRIFGDIHIQCATPLPTPIMGRWSKSTMIGLIKS